MSLASRWPFGQRLRELAFPYQAVSSQKQQKHSRKLNRGGHRVKDSRITSHEILSLLLRLHYHARCLVHTRSMRVTTWTPKSPPIEKVSSLEIYTGLRVVISLDAGTPRHCPFSNFEIHIHHSDDFYRHDVKDDGSNAWMFGPF